MIVIKKPIPLEARQYHILKVIELAEWANAHIMDNDFIVEGHTGGISVDDGDWIVKIDNGSYYEVYNNEEFIKIFERVQDGEQV